MRMTSRTRFIEKSIVLAALSATLVVTGTLNAANITHVANKDGATIYSWNDTNRWSSGGIPTSAAAGDLVSYNNGGGNVGMTLDIDATIGSLKVATKTFTLNKNSPTANVLTFDNTGATGGGNASIRSEGATAGAAGGSIVINPDIIIAGTDLDIYHYGGSFVNLTLTGNITSVGTHTLNLINNASTGNSTTYFRINGGINHRGAIVTSSSAGFTALNSNELELNGNIGANVTGLTLGATGVTIIKGTNSYTGVTTLTNGTIQARSTTALSTGNVSLTNGATLDIGGTGVTGAIGDNAVLSLSNGAKLVLASTVNDTIKSLVIDGIVQQVGVYSGVAGAGVNFVIPTYISGSGKLTVLAAPEPTSLALLAVGGLLMLPRKRVRG